MTIQADAPTVELLIRAEQSTHDRLIAELDLLGFDAFLQDQDELRAYAAQSHWTAGLEDDIQRLLTTLAIPSEPEVQVIAPENWNARWERSVQSVVVGQFVVTPSWKRDENHDPDLVLLEIDPKMSFGTGYHATTRLMLHLLPPVLHKNDRVLDAGTGTGILAIAAAKLGASSVIAVDIDPWSERNARENCEQNGVANQVEIRLADLEAVTESAFDVILANIQLDVITNALPLLKEKLAPGGRMLISGILVDQASAVTSAAGNLGLSIVQSEIEEEWWAVALRIA